MAEAIQKAPMDEFAALDAGPRVPNYVTPEVHRGEVFGSERRIPMQFQNHASKGGVAVGAMAQGVPRGVEGAYRQSSPAQPQGPAESPRTSTTDHDQFWGPSEHGRRGSSFLPWRRRS